MMANIYWINKLYNVRTVVALSTFFSVHDQIGLKFIGVVANILNRSIFFLCVCVFFFHILLVFQVGIVDDGY